LRELAAAVIAANPRTVLVSLSSPYLLRELPQAPAYLVGYNYTPFSLEAMEQVLVGRLRPQGRVPVSLPGLFERGDGLHYPG
jgi:beta-N-acetylhexosaminidase